MKIMAKKKSAAQIRRMQKRALARGEEYVVVEMEDPKLTIAKKLKEELDQIQNDTNLNAKERRSAKRKAEAIAEESGCKVEELLALLEKSVNETEKNKKAEDTDPKLKIAMKLKEELDQIQNDTNLNAKERRSAKRKAEAIAEESGFQVEELLSLLEKSARKKASSDEKEKEENPTKKRKTNPYVLFVGQLSFKTEPQQIFEHFQNFLGKELIHETSFRVRLLTDAKKQNRSRGMAFIETDTPELLYECLKLHHTTLDGRRINVERSSGGGKNESRREKLNQYRKEQNDYISDTVDKIISEYKANGSIAEGELDEGVILLCKRHSASTIETALAQYVESRGDTVDNPSAYLTSIICRVREEGVENDPSEKNGITTKFSE